MRNGHGNKFQWKEIDTVALFPATNFVKLITYPCADAAGCFLSRCVRYVHMEAARTTVKASEYAAEIYAVKMFLHRKIYKLRVRRYVLFYLI